MTTLYKPVPTSSAEQAEALPEGTIATSEEFAPEVFVKVGPNEWFGTHGPGTMTDLTAVGWLALAPIEAEEVHVIASGGLERDYHGATVFNHTPDGPRRDYRRTEFHTPWEEA